METARTPTRRGPYAKSSRQREAIIEAALKHFAEHGYHGVSMREIARQVGLSQAGLLHHFPTKTDLLTSVLASRDMLSVATANEATDTIDDPLAVMIAVVADNVRNRELVQMFTVVSAEATEETHPAHHHFRDRTQLVIELMRASLESAVEQGSVRADLDCDEAARQCQAMMYGLQVQWLFDPATDMVHIFKQFLNSLADK